MRQRSQRWPRPKPRRFDLLIAAVAVALNVPLITRYEKDFVGIHDALTVVAVV